MPRRERWSIIGAVLRAIDEQLRRDGGGARVTNVAARANVSYDRLLQYLDELAEVGMVTRDRRMPALTPKGREFLREYRHFQETLDRFGLDR